jgi:glycosyltransferase involved in cell wall biosynthesis
MRVLHVVPDLASESGGPSTAAVNLCESLAELGVEVSLVTTDYRMNGRIVPSGVNLHVFHCAFSRWRWSPSLWRDLKPLLGQVQVVHLHGVWLYPIWAAAQLSRGQAIPYLIRPCGMLQSWSLSQSAWRKRTYAALFERQTIRHAAAIHFTAEIEHVESQTLASASPGCVVPLAIPRDGYQDLPPPGTFRRRYPKLEGKRLILFLGRLHYKKQPDLLLQAFSRIVPEFPEAVLVLAGPGDAQYLSLLRSKAQDLGVAERVVFTGLLQGRAIQEALVDADLFALPSLQENFGLAAAEAMAAGCPVVVTPHVALARQIQEYSAGLVTESDAEALGNAIRLLLRGEAQRHAMGRNGRQLVMDRFTWKRVATQMLEVYEDIVLGTRTSLAWR